MHALTHSLAHRGPGASRARSRWQPYSSTLNPTCSVQIRSPQPYLHTPASSILSASPASYISPVTHLEPARKPTPPQPGSTLREAHKNKHVTRLVDQAVKSLGDIWRPEDIPVVFQTSSQATTPGATVGDKPAHDVPLIQLNMRHSHLPSPVSPSSQMSPFCSPSINTTNVPASTGCVRTDHLMPIRGFVHEVLRRSRTSTSVLQTALCYLEAVRTKVPGILEQERLKESQPSPCVEEATASRIVIGTEEDILASSGCDFLASSEAFEGAASVPTVCIVNAHPQEPLTAPPTEILADVDSIPPPICASASKTPSPPLTPLPPMPSPLLCPRRTFLACLILASKFTQDRSYSNKAWAKLAGLPPREIGRCERALGEALEWRLWVGKCPQPASTSGTVHRAVARCKSEFIVQTAPTCAWPTPTTPAALYSAHVGAVRSGGAHSALRRAATMPDLESGGRQCEDFGFSLGIAPQPSQSSMEATLIAEPDMDEFDVSNSGFLPSALAAPALQASLYAGDVSSPSVSTPGLAYSPMSTSSSDDGERTVSMGFRHAASTFGAAEADLPDSKSTMAAGCSPFASGDMVYHGGTRFLPAEPFVANDPSRLAPPSEAVFNPAILERSVGSYPGFAVPGVSANFYNSTVNWSVSGLH